MLRDNLEGLWDEEVGGRFKMEGKYVYLSRCCMAETNTTLQTNYLPITKDLKKEKPKTVLGKSSF